MNESNKSRTPYEIQKKDTLHAEVDDYSPSPAKTETDTIHGLNLADLEDGSRVTVQECIRHIRMLKHNIDKLEGDKNKNSTLLQEITMTYNRSDAELKLAQQANTYLQEKNDELHTRFLAWDLLQIIGASLLGFVPFIYNEIPDTASSARLLITVVLAILAIVVVAVPFFIKKRKKS